MVAVLLFLCAARLFIAHNHSIYSWMMMMMMMMMIYTMCHKIQRQQKSSRCSGLDQLMNKERVISLRALRTYTS